MDEERRDIIPRRHDGLPVAEILMHMLCDRLRRPLPLAAWMLLLLPCPSQAGERYFMIIFGAESHPKLFRLTHTFATIVRTYDPRFDPRGADATPLAGPPMVLEVHTISWLPQTLTVHPLRLYAEPGVNLDLPTTLRWCCDNRMHVSEWGLYEITQDFYCRVYREYARIESGEFLYKAADPFARGSRTTDCIHAVSDIDPYDSRAAYLYLRAGDPASRKLVRTLYMRRRLIDAPADACWVNAALGLDQYPIIHRPDPVWGLR